MWNPAVPVGDVTEDLALLVFWLLAPATVEKALEGGQTAVSRNCRAEAPSQRLLERITELLLAALLSKPEAEVCEANPAFEVELLAVLSCLR